MRVLMAAAMAAAMATPALAAGDAFEQGKVRVQTADLDLSTAAGQRALDQRIEVAVTRLCGIPVFFSREEIADLDACRTEALAAAAPQIDAARAQLAVAVAARR
jgi:UrcA family protein